MAKEKRYKLFFQQKELLDTFLSNGAITQAQYNKSYGDLAKKMGMPTEKVLAACGNDCSFCPRYVSPPYEKTEEELHHTAELWKKIG